MNNINFLKSRHMLEDIRFSLGVEEDDDSMDEEINNMSPLELTRQFTQFELGDTSWADDIINFYNDAIKNKG